jgi:hypothetical protein
LKSKQVNDVDVDSFDATEEGMIHGRKTGYRKGINE